MSKEKLLCSRPQIGVLSWGEGCAEKKAYGAYTRVSTYSDWIQAHTGPLRGAPPLPVDESLTAAQLGQVLARLETALDSAKGRVRIGVRGGNRVPLHQKVVFEPDSCTRKPLTICGVSG